MEQNILSTTPYQQSGNYRKSWNTKNKRHFVSEEQRARNARDEQIMARFNELGYSKGDNGNLPCFCGKTDENTAWWMSNCKSKSNHLFCPRCAERIFEPEIKETLVKLLGLWKKYKMRMWKVEEASIGKLLSKGNNA
jgi:hypothetical protein